MSSTSTAPPEVTMATSERVPSEITQLSIVSVTTVSIASVALEGTVPRTESVETLLSKVSSASKESSIESIPSERVLSSEELTESIPPERVLSSEELTESIPPERVLSSEELTESIPPERVLSSEKLTESIPPPVRVLSSEELTESVPPPEVATGSVPLEISVAPKETEATTLSIQSAPPPDVTIASTQSIPPISTATSTLSATSDLSALSISPPPNSDALSAPLAAPSELATASPPPKLTPVSTGSDPQELTKAQEDATNLHTAFKGWGCDAARVVQTLAHRNATQRALIKEVYKRKFSEDLEERLSSELSGDVKRAILLWMLDPARRDATIVRQSLHQLRKKLVVIEVICSRTPSQIQELKMAYGLMFDASLEQDIENHSSGDTKELLLACVRKQRSQGPEVDATMVDKDAKALYKDGQYAIGTNESTFIRIFSERSWAHLAAVSSTYHSMYVDSLAKAVKKETSGKFECALLTILQCAENPGNYFAEVLHKAMKGAGTNEETLTRIIVSRAEVDIQQIKAEYLKKYKKSLSEVVHSETSGEYRTFLRSLLDPIIN